MRFTDDADLNRQGPGAVRRGGQRQSAWHDLPDTLGDAGRKSGPIWGNCRTASPWHRTSGRTGRWPGTASSAGRAPATVSTGDGWEGRCRWGSGWARWRVWAGDERIAVHPRAQQAGQRFILPGQWAGLSRADGRPVKEALAVQVPVGQVERRSLEVYELATSGGVR